jgi:hypothetical protein
VLYFHAQFRRTVTKRGVPVTILETTGRGRYVGTAGRPAAAPPGTSAMKQK